MDGNFAFLLPILTAGFAGAFLLVWWKGRSPAALAWALASLFDSLAFGSEALPGLSDEAIAILSDALFALAFFCYAEALILRFRLARLYPLRLALLAFSIAAAAWTVLAMDDLRAELIASDTLCSLATAVALLRIPMWRQRPIDLAVLLLSWLVVADNSVRSVLTGTIAAGADFRTYLASDYAFVLQVTCTISGFAFGLVALAAVMLDVIARYRRESQSDPLTGLLNRRGFDEAARAACAARPLGSVLTCDLDHFKRINDRFGHLVGDRVIADFAGLLGATLPAGAVAARFGGEEFVIYLPATTVFEASRIAEAVRAEVAGNDWIALGLEEAPTASFGLADLTGEPDPLYGALARADRGLYDAKYSGRDRIATRLAA